MMLILVYKFEYVLRPFSLGDHIMTYFFPVECLSLGI